jgi:formate hydrogenlyase transcriptional activator
LTIDFWQGISLEWLEPYLTVLEGKVFTVCKDEDRSPESLTEKNVLLRLVSIFEGEFSIDWLVELAGLRASLVVSILEEEVQNQTIQRNKPAIYAWKDAGERKRWLQRLAPEEKKDYHLRVASILIHELPKSETKVLEAAPHLLQLSNDVANCALLLQAGEVHARSHSSEKAIACFEKVLSDLSGQEGNAEDRLYAKAALLHSDLVTISGVTPQTLAFLKQARARAVRQKDAFSEILLELDVAKYEWLSSRFEEAFRHFKRAFVRVRQSGDAQLLAAATPVCAHFLFWEGRFHDVIHLYESSLPDVTRYPIGNFPLLAASAVGRSYVALGQLTQGLGMMDTALELCRRRSDLVLSANIELAIGTTMVCINRVEDAFPYLRSALQGSQRTHNQPVRLVVTFVLAVANLRKGNTEECSRYLRLFLRDRRKNNIALLLNPQLMEICWAMKTGQLPALPGLSFEDEMTRMLESRNIFWKGIAFRYRAFLGRMEGWPQTKIAHCLVMSSRWLELSGEQIEIAKTQIELARHHASKGTDHKAKKAMLNATRILSSINIDLIPADLKHLIAGQDRGEIILREISELHRVTMHDDSRLLQQIIAAINRITGAERGAVFLVEQDENELQLEICASQNLTFEQISEPSFSAIRTILKKSASSGEGMVFDSTVFDDASSSSSLVRSGMCLPLITKGKTIGVLYQDNRLLGNIFKKTDLLALDYFATLAAVDLDRARAREEVQAYQARQEEEKKPLEIEMTDGVSVEGVIGSSPFFQAVLSQVELAAKNDSAVLLFGETGVGKNMIAELIHRHSSRRLGPFICVQCSALTESLITSELFGHEKGAFTGATGRRIGRFELAHGGTLFLDEIGDLSQEVQVRLLRVLQTKEFERVGGGKETVTSDFRLIAATNKNLQEEVEAGRFRIDLYYRINVFPLEIPPLRKRREDIPVMANYFFRRYRSKEKNTAERIPEDVIGQLTKYDWPGNVRELDNVVHRGTILGRDTHFVLPPQWKGQGASAEKHTFLTLQANEKEHIIKALQTTGGKIHGPGGAAELLGINSRSLASRMRRLGLKKSTTTGLRQNYVGG